MFLKNAGICIQLHKNVPFSLDIKFTSTNRFEPLAMLETQTDGDKFNPATETLDSQLYQI
jgi:hypothetical protein